jgi:hypothetical protein
VSQLSIQCGILNISQPYRPPRSVTGIALLFYIYSSLACESIYIHSSETFISLTLCVRAQTFVLSETRSASAHASHSWINCRNCSRDASCFSSHLLPRTGTRSSTAGSDWLMLFVVPHLPRHNKINWRHWQFGGSTVCFSLLVRSPNKLMWNKSRHILNRIALKINKWGHSDDRDQLAGIICSVPVLTEHSISRSASTPGWLSCGWCHTWWRVGTLLCICLWILTSNTAPGPASPPC